ncbi:hypothetical protein CLHUN_02220 [Ruminiclostridium hungatei]|uniref:Uncharacterized protein n=1 Tax=Ruminiclostridium hungatei TaxID=48256 RepID=A0A1V4SSG2_RUMHU|nr:hypothetical protein [Ruminiclostridium hungatei]OPX46406.1 hypothetical protein CLHUN_02220 [Ruminiclostridium hungatei]
MKLNLDDNLLDLIGVPQNDRLCEILADILATSSTNRPAQTMAWAYDLIKTGEIEITKDDAAFISDLIKKNQSFIDLAKAQLLEKIEMLKD